MSGNLYFESMVLPRRPWFVAGVFAGLAWAGMLSSLGFQWLAQGLPSQPGPVAPLLGVAALAAGQFVFLVLVADRCFPRVSPRLRGAIETTSLVVLFTSLAVACTLLLTGVVFR